MRLSDVPMYMLSRNCFIASSLMAVVVLLIWPTFMPSRCVELRPALFELPRFYVIQRSVRSSEVLLTNKPATG